jgi:hypothetical protein
VSFPFDFEKNGMVRAWHGRGMANVNQTRPHCVNQMGKTHSKPLSARHGRGTAWVRHAMCESTFTDPFQTFRERHVLTLSDPKSDLVRQYNFPVLFRCRKTSDTGFVAFVRPLSEPVQRLSSCSTDFSQQIAQFALFLFLHVSLF